MKIISWNVNGIRACAQKGFLDYLKSESPDILCLQEVKALPEQLTEELRNPSGYHTVWHPAEKKGYSGVALLTKSKPTMVLEGMGIDRYDREGRVIIAEYPDFTLLNIYFPNGQKDEHRLQFKLDFYRDLFAYCNELKSEGKNLVICGDYNTAHNEIDLARPKENANTSGFMPIERAWIDKIIDDYHYVDTFRHFHKEPDQYSWWSYRMRARDRNIGWRIDYVFVNDAFLPRVNSAFIQQSVKGSDHCPVGITIA